MERVRGHTSLRDLAARSGLSVEGVRKRLRRQATEHITHLTMEMWDAQRQGGLLTLAVPPGTDAEHDAAVNYAQWVAGEMIRQDLRVAFTYSPAGAEGGFVLALEDLDFPGGDR